jgi:hypothetical protein
MEIQHRIAHYLEASVTNLKTLQPSPPLIGEQRRAAAREPPTGICAA